MKFMGKPFFHGYGYGAKVAVNKEEIKISQMPPTLIMQSSLMKESFLQKTKKKSTKDKSANKVQPSPEFIEKLLKEYPNKYSFQTGGAATIDKQRNSLQVPSSSKEYGGSFSRVPSPQPVSRLPSLGKKMATRVTSEDKKIFSSSYLQRERFKRYLDSSQKVTWETMERLNKEDLKELIKTEFDPSSLLNPQSEEDKRYLIQIGVNQPPKSQPKTNFLKVADQIQAKSRSRSPAGPNINRPLSELAPHKKNSSKKKLDKSGTSIPKSPQHTIPGTTAVSRVVTTSNQLNAQKPSQNPKSKSKTKGVSKERLRARELSIENQAKRHQNLIAMLKNKLS